LSVAWPQINIPNRFFSQFNAETTSKTPTFAAKNHDLSLMDSRTLQLITSIKSPIERTNPQTIFSIFPKLKSNQAQIPNFVFADLETIRKVAGAPQRRPPKQ
jgi:hypothetical protein